MTIKIGINGMGRIGRMVVRAIIENNNKDILIKHINNRSNLETTSLTPKALAYLIACLNCSLSEFLPLSISTNSE